MRRMYDRVRRTFSVVVLVMCFGLLFAFTIGCNEETEIGRVSRESVDTSAPDVAHTPEPATLILLGAGLVGLGAAGLRKHRKK